MNRSYPEGKTVATAHQHGANDSGGFKIKMKPAQRKSSKDGQKEHSNREGHSAQARPVKNFQNAGDVKNDTAGL